MQAGCSHSSNHSAIMLNPPFLSFIIYAYGRLETDFVIKKMVRGRTVLLLLMIKELKLEVVVKDCNDNI